MRTQTRQTDGGFTLVEMLAVLAILAVTASAFSFAGGRSLETAKMRAFLIKTAAVLREARSSAIRTQDEALVEVDAARHELRFGGDTLAFPPGTALDATLAASGDGIRFFPAGGSTGGALAFSFRDSVYEIRVNWLTGNVTQRVN
jgi:general secretion pathway protein H